MISGESEHANPGVRLAVFDRKAKTGKRLMRGVQAIGVLSDIPIAHLRGDQIVASDVVGGSAGKLIGFFNNIIVIFEQRQNIFNSTSHVVKVMRAGHPARCLVELGTDEFRKLAKCAESIGTLQSPIVARSLKACPASNRYLHRIEHLSNRGGMCRCADIKRNIASKMLAVQFVLRQDGSPGDNVDRGSFMSTRVGGRARDMSRR